MPLFSLRGMSVLVCLGLLAGAIAAGCKQVEDLINFARCQYKLANVSDITLAGVNFQNKTSVTDLSLIEIGSLGQAYISNRYPLTMNVNVDVQNTQKDTAAITKVDYILALDNTEVTQGTLPNRFAVAPGITGRLPIGVSFDLKQAFSGKTSDALINLVLSLAGQSSNPTGVGLRIRPYFDIAGRSVQFPRYFTVKTTLSGDSLGL